ncbi:MAG: hypothetical protein K0S55_1800 [Clostridia bacterium]|nr:hypothetical protein [Clostridia bacterium]
MFLHVGASQWYNTDITSFEWQVFNIYDSLVRFCVPVFVMLSGMFFLEPGKQISLKNIYFKYILRIVTAFIFWSAFYVIFDNFILHKNEINSKTIDNMFSQFYEGQYHLWFLFMIVGLYIITPLLKKLTENSDKKMLEYFILLSFVFAVLIPTLSNFPWFDGIRNYINKFYINLILGYSGYFIMGYYLKTYDISKLKQIIIYISGIIGVISTFALTNLISQSQGRAYEVLYGFLTPNVMLASVAVFVFFKEIISKIKFKDITIRVITFISSCSFGMYLVHVAFNMIFSKIKFTTLSFNPLISVPLISIAVFICSFLISFIISKIPFLNKYII